MLIFAPIVTNLDTGELFIGPDRVGEGGLMGVPGVLLQGVLLLQQHNLLHLLIWGQCGQVKKRHAKMSNI